MNTGVTLLDAANLQEMTDRLGAYRVLMLLQTQLAAKANKPVIPHYRFSKAADIIHAAAEKVDAVFHGEEVQS